MFFILSIYIDNSVEVYGDVRYDNYSLERNLMDIYVSEKVNSTLPALIIVYGGGWSEGSKDVDGVYGKYIAFEGEYVVYSINYRLSDTDSFPVQIEDLKSVVRWIKLNGDLYNTDTKNIFVMGFSAGGHLTSLLSSAYDYDFSEFDKSNISAKVNAVAVYAGPENLSSLVSDCKDNIYCKENSDALNYILNKLINCSIDICPEKYNIASPIYHVSSNDVPTLIVHGKIDNIVPLKQAEDFYNLKVEMGAVSQLVIVNESDHSIDYDFKYVKDFFNLYLVE